MAIYDKIRCSVSNIQNYFEYILKKHGYEYILKRQGEKTNNHLIKVYVNNMENRVLFKIKIGSDLELLTPETMKLLRSKIKVK